MEASIQFSSVSMISLVEYDEQFLELSWLWLNDPEIERLTDTKKFSKDSQRKWFDGLAGRKDYFVWGIRYLDERIGAVGIKNIQDNKGEAFVYIGCKQYWGKSLGTQAIKLLKEYAMTTLRLKSINLRVFKNNLLAIGAYRKNGFIVTHEDSDYAFMECTLVKR